MFSVAFDLRNFLKAKGFLFFFIYVLKDVSPEVQAVLVLFI